MKTDIKEIGVYDADLGYFENQYPVPEGVTYNSYLIVDDSIAVIDTVDNRAAATWRENLQNALPAGRTPDYLIVEHLEPDHSGEIKWLMETYPDCKLVCTAAAARMLPLVTDDDSLTERVITVADGDTLSLGHRSLTFITAPMIHWPEVMMVHDSATHTLFSADAFGRFGRPESPDWAEEGARYYYNIVGKYGPAVRTVLGKVAKLPVERIAPLHGPVLEGPVEPYLRLYGQWSSYTPETDGVLVAYASIHGFTARAARVMAEKLREAGASEVHLVDLTADDLSFAVREAFRVSRLVVMASTYDGEVFTPMREFLQRLAHKGYRNRAVGIVENGLWAPAAAKKMKELLATMPGITIAEPVITLRGRHTPADESALASLAHSILNVTLN